MNSCHAVFSHLASLLRTSLPIAHAEEITTKAVQFAKDHSSAIIKGMIKARQAIDYTLHAKAGQIMSVKLISAHGANYFNVLPPGSNDTAITQTSSLSRRTATNGKDLGLPTANTPFEAI